jgi:hypothetical protein
MFAVCQLWTTAGYFLMSNDATIYGSLCANFKTVISVKTARVLWSNLSNTKMCILATYLMQNNYHSQFSPPFCSCKEILQISIQNHLIAFLHIWICNTGGSQPNVKCPGRVRSSRSVCPCAGSHRDITPVDWLLPVTSHRALWLAPSPSSNNWLLQISPTCAVLWQ